jgi:hypothetical protein
MSVLSNAKIGDFQPWYDGVQLRTTKTQGNTVSDFTHWYDGLQYAPAIPANTGGFLMFVPF